MVTGPTLTSAERVALQSIREERPEIFAALQEWLAPVLGDLSQSCQGLLVNELEVDDFLDRFCSEFVGRVMAEMEPWGRTRISARTRWDSWSDIS